MKWNLLFFLNSTLLGAGLAMDAFSVSLANGLHEPDMHRKKNVRHCGRLCLLSGIDADDRLDMRPYHAPVFHNV